MYAGVAAHSRCACRSAPAPLSSVIRGGCIDCNAIRESPRTSEVFGCKTIQSHGTSSNPLSPLRPTQAVLELRVVYHIRTSVAYMCFIRTDYLDLDALSSLQKLVQLGRPSLGTPVDLTQYFNACRRTHAHFPRRQDEPDVLHLAGIRPWEGRAERADEGDVGSDYVASGPLRSGQVRSGLVASEPRQPARRISRI